MSVRTLNYRPAPTPVVGLNPMVIKKGKLPKEHMPVLKQRDVYPAMKSAPKPSKATTFARDFLEEKKRQELVDLYHEKLSQQLNRNSGYEQQVLSNTFIRAENKAPFSQALNNIQPGDDPAIPPPPIRPPPRPPRIDPVDLVDTPAAPPPPPPPAPPKTEEDLMELDPALQQIVHNNYLNYVNNNYNQLTLNQYLQQNDFHNHWQQNIYNQQQSFQQNIYNELNQYLQQNLNVNNTANNKFIHNNNLQQNYITENNNNTLNLAYDTPQNIAQDHVMAIEPSPSGVTVEMLDDQPQIAPYQQPQISSGGGQLQIAGPSGSGSMVLSNSQFGQHARHSGGQPSRHLSGQSLVIENSPSQMLITDVLGQPSQNYQQLVDPRSDLARWRKLSKAQGKRRAENPQSQALVSRENVGKKRHAPYPKQKSIQQGGPSNAPY